MNLDDYKLLFITIGLIGVLLIASPAFITFLGVPSGEQFSQLYLLGPEHQAKNYPFTIQGNQNYSVYVGVANNMGSSQYYLLQIKFRNQTDPLPNSSLATPSSLSSIYKYKFAISNGTTWERFFTFSASDITFSGNVSCVGVLSLNGLSFNVNKPSVLNTNSSMFFYQLLFELWIYNTQTGLFEYNNRNVNLQLNMSKGSL